MEKQKPLAPVVLFAYNRLWHTKQTVEALKKNNLAKQTLLYVFSDAPSEKETHKKVQEVRAYLRTINGFKKIEIVEREKNYGVAENLIQAIDEVIKKHGKVIMLEDDDITSKYFLKYMNEALDFYEEDERVFQISPYIYPLKGNLPETFFLRLINSWGFATWSRAWNFFERDGKRLLSEIERKGLKREFDIGGTYPYTKMLKHQIEGKNNSWAIRLYASFFLNKGLTLYPGKSLVKNIGFDDTGTHGDRTDRFNTAITDLPIRIREISVKPNEKAYEELQKYFRSIRFGRIMNKFKRTLKHPVKELRKL